MTKSILPNSYQALLGEIKERIRSAHYAALKAVNKELILMYWDVGRMISTKISREKWGKSVVETLAQDLRRDLPGIKGFSASNLWRTRVFFETYSRREKLAPLVREIGCLDTCRMVVSRSLSL